jgi:alcohol dehydrogenase, propanol-preferring
LDLRLESNGLQKYALTAVSIPPSASGLPSKFVLVLNTFIDNCLVGAESECHSLKVSGFFHPGTFQQYLTASAKCVTPIPEGIDLAGAAPLMCAGVSVYAGLKRAHTKAGDWVLVSGGGGGLGHLAIQYAKAMGARVIAMDVSSKEAFCKEVGADFFIDFTKFGTDEDIIAEVKGIVPGGVKVVLCCVGSKRAYLQAQTFLGPRGTLVCLGIPVIPAGESTALFELGPLVLNELNIIGRRIYTLLSSIH